jgi:hypothetical protein
MKPYTMTSENTKTGIFKVCVDEQHVKCPAIITHRTAFADDAEEETV